MWEGGNIPGIRRHDQLGMETCSLSHTIVRQVGHFRSFGPTRPTSQDAPRQVYTPRDQVRATRLVTERLSDSNVTAMIRLTMGFANCSGAIDAAPPLASA